MQRLSAGFLSLLSITSAGLGSAAAQTTWTPMTRNAVPEIVSAVMAPGGFRLEMAAPPGNYTLERSTSLLSGSWQPVGQIEPLLGSGEITDGAALSLPAAFYRVAGGFQETEMKLIAFDSLITSGGYLEYDTYGGLWTGQSHEDLWFQSSNAANGMVKFTDGQSAKFRLEPANGAGVVSAYMERWNDIEALPVGVSGSSWNFTFDEGNLVLRKLEGGNHSLFGINRHTDQYQETDEFGTYVNNERSVESIWAIAKSSNANPADLAGDWGFVRIMVDGIDSDAVFNGEAWSTTMTAGTNPRPFSVASYTDFDVEHIWPSGDVAAVYNSLVIHNPPVTPLLSLAADGSVIITNTDGGSDLKGMVSPSAKLLVATGIDPDISEIPVGGTEVFLPELDGAVSEWLVGVKKTNSLQLAGKTYRVLRKSWWMEGAAFEIDFSGPADRLVFNATGTSVTRTFDSIYDVVDFDGNFSSGTGSEPLPMSVNVDSGGKIQLQAVIPGDYTARAFGYAQEGSNLLVMIETGETVDGAAGVGLIIAVLEP